MLLYIRYIFQGWFNRMFGFLVSARHGKEFAERLRICGDCRHNVDGRCDLCGCFVSAKTKVPELGCQAGKWNPIPKP